MNAAKINNHVAFKGHVSAGLNQNRTYTELLTKAMADERDPATSSEITKLTNQISLGKLLVEKYDVQQRLAAIQNDIDKDNGTAKQVGFNRMA